MNNIGGAVAAAALLIILAKPWEWPTTSNANHEEQTTSKAPQIIALSDAVQDGAGQKFAIGQALKKMAPRFIPATQVQ